MKKELGERRKINGEYWYLHTSYMNKNYSIEIAEQLRKRGIKARLLKTTFGVWGVYTPNGTKD